MALAQWQQIPMHIVEDVGLVFPFVQCTYDFVTVRLTISLLVVATFVVC